MHWIEGIIMIGAGFIAWLIATGRFPADPEQRRNLETRLPWVNNGKLMWGMALFLWILGSAAVVGIMH